tara:strand:- start:528 stop:896 length:369 start_codon:yes stop_codon:yes gene_type:complete
MSRSIVSLLGSVSTGNSSLRQIVSIGVLGSSIPLFPEIGSTVISLLAQVDNNVGTVSAIALAILSLLGVVLREVFSMLRRGNEPTIGELTRRLDRIEADYRDVCSTLREVRDDVRDATALLK